MSPHSGLSINKLKVIKKIPKKYLSSWYVQSSVLNVLHRLSHLSFTITMGSYYYYFFFGDEKIG